MPRVRGPSGWETILVVDDEKSVLSFTCAVLSANGYDVLEAASGAKAIEICLAKKPAIHLLLTDVMMPNMTGPQLAERLHPLYPDMRILFMSGYQDYQFENYRPFPIKSLMRKPFTPSVLLATVREALDTPHNRDPSQKEQPARARKRGSDCGN